MPVRARPDEPLELEREARLRLVARRLERLRRPVGELDREPEGRRVERRAAERSRDEELARWQHGSHPDDLQPRNRSVGVGEDAAVHVRGRVLGIGAKAPARDLDGCLTEQVVEPVAGVHAVRDDRRQSLERAQPPRVALRVALGVGALVADRRLDQQRSPEHACRDQLAQPVDRGVVAVGEPDLQPFRRARGVAHIGSLGDRERDRLLGEHVLPSLERGANETCGRRRWRCDHDGIHVRVREDGVGVGCGGDAGRRERREPVGVGVGDSDESRAWLGRDCREMGPHADVAKADEPDPELRLAHPPTLSKG